MAPPLGELAWPQAVTERAVRFRPSPSPAGKAMDAAVNPHRADTQVGPYPVE